jgi:hypothetical protein
MRQIKGYLIFSFVFVSVVSIFFLFGCGWIDSVVVDEGDSPSSPVSITVSGVVCEDGDATDTCNDVGGADAGVYNVIIHLRDGERVMKVGKTDFDGRYLIENVQELPDDAPYNITLRKNGYVFLPARFDSDEVHTSDRTADFTAIYVW